MYKDIIEFWFDEIDAQMWWKKDPDFDNLIQARFDHQLRRAAAGELFDWRDSALGSLAEVIILVTGSSSAIRI